MDNLIVANLRSRPTRSLISIFAVAIGVILFLLIDGMTKGTLNDTANRTMGIGADFILQSSDAGMLFAFSEAALPVKIADKLRQIEGVEAVAPVISKFQSKNFGIVFGIDLKTYDQLPGKLQIVAGRRSLSGDDMIVDEIYAKNKNIKPGMQIEVQGHKFTVSGICRQGSAVRQFVPLDTLQQLMEAGDKVTIMLIKAAPGADLKRLEENLKNIGNVIGASDANALLSGTHIPLLKEFGIAVKFISMLISFIVILLAMYTTIFERTREIGILKSLGASRAFVVAMVLRESVVICILGVLLGTGVSQILRKIITMAAPTLQVQMNLSEVGMGCMLGLIAGILGALYPAYKAAQMDPVKALSYE